MTKKTTTRKKAPAPYAVVNCAPLDDDGNENVAEVYEINIPDVYGAEIDLEVTGDRLSWQGSLRAPARFVYVRVIRGDGECAWSSPVFIDRPV